MVVKGLRTDTEVVLVSYSKVLCAKNPPQGKRDAGTVSVRAGGSGEE